MKKFINLTTIAVSLCILATMACGCSEKNSEEETQAINESTVTEATSATVVEPYVATIETTTTTTAEETIVTTVESTIESVEETSATTVEATISDVITDEMAVDAITNRCVLENPDLTTMMAEGNYTFYWEVVSSTDSQVVVLYRSYTGAEIRYYIDRVTGNTTVTELVPGIIDEEQATGETFNARDHIAPEIYG